MRAPASHAPWAIASLPDINSMSEPFRVINPLGNYTATRTTRPGQTSKTEPNGARFAHVAILGAVRSAPVDTRDRVYSSL